MIWACEDREVILLSIEHAAESRGEKLNEGLIRVRFIGKTKYELNTCLI